MSHRLKTLSLSLALLVAFTASPPAFASCAGGSFGHAYAAAFGAIVSIAGGLASTISGAVALGKPNATAGGVAIGAGVLLGVLPALPVLRCGEGWWLAGLSGLGIGLGLAGVIRARNESGPPAPSGKGRFVVPGPTFGFRF